MQNFSGKGVLKPMEEYLEEPGTDLVFPTTSGGRLEVPDFKSWRLSQVWDLEDRLVGAKELVSDYIDEEICRLTTEEKWSQKAIAEICGRDQSTVSRRMKRLAIIPVHKTIPGPRKESMHAHTSDDLEDDDFVLVGVDYGKAADDAAVVIGLDGDPLTFGPRKIKQEERRLRAIWEYAEAINSAVSRADLVVLKHTLSEGEDKDKCQRSLQNARTALGRILAAL